ncbi:MAG: peptidase M48, partial [Bacteroidetes bacterium HGW-Bacteroidetes-6]
MEGYVLILIVGFLLFDYLVDTFLSILNMRNWQTDVPGNLQDFYPSAKYKEARLYTRERMQLHYVSSAFQVAIILVMIFGGGFALIDEFAESVVSNPIGHSLVFLFVLFLGSDILLLPFQWYSVFSIEERFGFNKTTRTTFVTDKLKSYFIAAIIGGGMFWLLSGIYFAIPDYFWLLAWGIITVFSLLMTMFYSNVIVPLFNRQTPLEQGELRDSIEKFAGNTGFVLKNIFVINGSKRSTKTNAYFTGIGSQKRIVLYDTLIERHTTNEIVAVLAHEIGHYRKKHVLTGFAISTATMLGLLYMLNIVLSIPDFALALGMQPSLHASLLVFAMLFSPVSMLISIFSNIVSRRHEFAADRFAKENGVGEAL